MEEISTRLVKSTALERRCSEILVIEFPESLRFASDTLYEIMTMKMLCILQGALEH